MFGWKSSFKTDVTLRQPDFKVVARFPPPAAATYALPESNGDAHSVILHLWGKNGTGRAVTKDPSGANLPKRQFGWQFVEETDIEPLDGPPSQNIVERIEKDGCFV